MRCFDYNLLKNLSFKSDIVKLIANIYALKSLQNKYTSAKSNTLDKLVEIAKIQSTEASNYIEGIMTTAPRLKQLCADKTTPRNRDEEQILGYREVLNTIHDSYEYIDLSKNVILQLHKILYSKTVVNFGGHFKNVPNEIDAIDENGNKTFLFRPLEPYQTPDAVDMICKCYNQVFAKENVEPLILIPCFILDFLCIHPFNDGNGRMSRLLTLLLLYKAGFTVGKYISIEKAIADSKDAYYEALKVSDQNWHQGQNDPKPFIKYMLEVLLACYKDFDERVNLVSPKPTNITAYDVVKEFALNKLGLFTKQEAFEKCGKYSRASIENALKLLVDEGIVDKVGKGPATKYVHKNFD